MLFGLPFPLDFVKASTLLEFVINIDHLHELVAGLDKTAVQKNFRKGDEVHSQAIILKALKN